MRARLALLLLAAAALAPSPARAQRDTIRLGTRDTAAAPADTAAAPARDPRWSTPFAVQASGQVSPLRAPRDVVWLDADSVRARRRAARLAAADSTADDSTTAAPPADTAAAADTADAPPPRHPRRAAAADSAAAPRRTTTRTAARDTTATRRTTTRIAARDTAATRRAASADTAGRARTTPRPRTHRVAEGETLFGIARKYGVTTAQLRALNPELVAGELETGTVLRLPAGARPPAADSARTEPRRRASAETAEPTTRRPAAETAEPAARRPAAETRATPARGRRTHSVAAHETLYGIARRYGVTVDALKAANHLTGDALRTGQTLVIPPSPPH
jgi:LysM repeat protein